jgi:hypothetical protein
MATRENLNLFSLMQPTSHTNVFVGAEDKTQRRLSMRRVVLMVLTAAAIGVGGSAASAAPADGNAIGNASTSMSNVTHVQHWRWGSGGHWRWGSGGHWRWGSGGHWRWGSRGWRRWR